jgi:hypothetical protein
VLLLPLYNSQKENKKVSDNINPDPYKVTGSGSKKQHFADKKKLRNTIYRKGKK